jgi:hypothetical protein
VRLHAFLMLEVTMVSLRLSCFLVGIFIDQPVDDLVNFLGQEPKRRSELFDEHLHLLEKLHLTLQVQLNALHLSLEPGHVLLDVLNFAQDARGRVVVLPLVEPEFAALRETRIADLVHHDLGLEVTLARLAVNQVYQQGLLVIVHEKQHFVLELRLATRNRFGLLVLVVLL